MGVAMPIKNYGFDLNLIGMASLLNFIKIYQLVHKLMGGGAHRQDSDLISLRFSFRNEFRLNN
jgi:hypothetical protein